MISAASQVLGLDGSEWVAYVLCPLFLAGAIGTQRWAVGLGKRLDTQDKALGILVREVIPEGQPTLKDIVQGVSERVAHVEGIVDPNPFRMPQPRHERR